MRRNQNTNELEQQLKSLQQNLITAIESKISSASEETASIHTGIIQTALSLFKKSIQTGNGLATAGELLSDFEKNIEIYNSSSQESNLKNIQDLKELIAELKFFIAEVNKLKLQGSSFISGQALPTRSLFTEQSGNIGNNNNNNQNVISSEQNRNNSRNLNNNNNISEPGTLFETIQSKDLEEVKRIIEMDENCLNPGRHGTSPLHDAVAHGSIEIVKYFIKCNISIELADGNGRTVLHYASLNENYQMLAELLTLLSTHFADNNKLKEFINKKDTSSYGDTALICALQKGNFECATLLCANGADVMLANDVKKAPIYFIAQMCANQKKDNRIINQEKNILGLMKLLICFIENQEALKLQLNLPYSSDQVTPIMMAAQAGNLMLVEFLLEQGVQLYNIIEKKHLPICDAKGTSILHYAAKSGNVELFKFIFQQVNHYGNEINIKNNKNETILMFAAQSGSLEIVQFLIEKGVSTSEVSSSVEQANEAPPTQRTALHYAVQSRNLKVVEALVNAGAETNIQDENGQTSLRYAVNVESAEIAKALVEAGANINIKDKEGETPQDKAKEIDDNSEKAEMLEALGVANPSRTLAF